MRQRGGEVAIPMLENVRQKTIAPLLRSRVAPGPLMMRDEYAIYARLEEWGYSPN
jgi:transposase